MRMDGGVRIKEEPRSVTSQVAVDDDVRFQGRSLDVLAAVASDRLPLDQKIAPPKKVKA